MTCASFPGTAEKRRALGPAPPVPRNKPQVSGKTKGYIAYPKSYHKWLVHTFCYVTVELLYDGTTGTNILSLIARCP